MLLTEPTYLLSISHQMILLALGETERIRDHSSIITQRTTIIFIRLIPPTNPTSPRQNSPSHGSHLNIQKISSLLFHQQARKSSAPENIQRLFRLPNCLSRKSSAPEHIQRLSGQQQQPAAATSSSNQQQQSAAAINSSNQQQQSAAAINSSNQQQQPPAATTNFRPTSSTYSITASFC